MQGANSADSSGIYDRELDKNAAARGRFGARPSSM